METDKEFLDQTFFSDEAVFHVIGKVYKHFTSHIFFFGLPNDRSIASSKASSPQSAT